MRASDDPFEPDLWQSRPRFVWAPTTGRNWTNSVRRVNCDGKYYTTERCEGQGCMTILAAAVPTRAKGKKRGRLVRGPSDSGIMTACGFALCYR